MSVLHAIILGIVQGITEFLPISSQAHLYLLPYFFHWNYQGMDFDIALHWGTLVAILLIFWKDYWRYLKALVSPLLPFGHPPLARGGGDLDQKIAWFLILATIPGVILGILLDKAAETTFRSPWIILVTLVVFALVLQIADKKTATGNNLSILNWKKALGIGLAQAVAIAGLDRKSAARFSFLLSGPIIFGAGLVALKDLHGISPPLLAGFIFSALSGLLAIKFLLKYLESHGMNLFVWYRYALGVVILATLILK
jgi:undecaprenyl-diphosphatase